jgi:HEPN domain-containing protein
MAERRARAYLMEAELTLESAEAVFERAKLTGKRLWSKVVKEAYDAMEDCAAAALALKGVGVPRYHPAKIASFISQFGLEGSEVAGILTKWLSRRARAHYVDFNEMGRLRAPFEEFDEADAVEVLRDCRVVIEFVKKLIKKTAKSDET